jgi:hypothetical protein
MLPNGTLIGECLFDKNHANAVAIGYVIGHVRIKHKTFYKVLIFDGPPYRRHTLTLFDVQDSVQIPHELSPHAIAFIDTRLQEHTGRYKPGDRVRFPHGTTIYDDKDRVVDVPKTLYVRTVTRLDPKCIATYFRIQTMDADGHDRFEGAEMHFEPV